MRKAMIWVVAVFPSLCAAQEVTIVALGDSLTQGYGLVPEQGFVPQLQNWLDAQGLDTVLINAGVSGDTTAGGLSRVAWTLTPDVDAMIVTLGGNDMLRGIDPAVSRSNMAGILETARDADVDVLLVGMQAPGNFGPEYKSQFDAIYPELAAEYNVLLAASFFDGIVGESGDAASAQDFMQPDGIHPNADGVRRIVEALGPDVTELVSRVSRSLP